MNQASKPFYLFLLILFSISKINAQECTGNLGDPIQGAGTDFGAGTNTFGTAIGSTTNYSFTNASPDAAASYTIVKSTAGLNPGWHQNITNHSNDPNGYMMVVNASNAPGIFYQTTVAGLCPGVTYEFASYIINILKNPGIRPNVLFTIENDGAEIKRLSTGDIPEGTATDWVKYRITFTTPPDVGIITLRMTSQSQGSSGNDLALDDITFRPCGPIITTSINNSPSSHADLCVGQNASYHLAANISAGYNDPVYQWQSFNGSTWIDINGENLSQTTVNFTNAVVGTYKYRLAVAERPNMNSVICRTSSAVLTINVNDKPAPMASNSGAACVGGTVQLNVDQGVSFNWTGPNGFTSTIQNPIIPNVSINSAGTYTVTVLNASGCSSTSQTNVQVLPVVIANTNMTTATICENESINLEAIGGSSYSWLPVDGSLSNPNIAKPVASPKQTTTYQVTVSNGTCSTTKEITITVLKKPSANAGEDKKLFFGQSVSLEGSVAGDEVSYSWSPTDYLDDPTKLNPIASPPTDMTYTLTVQSRRCGTVTDNVFIKVYPKIEIPNTFTPNGDAKNDTWNIPALEAFPTHEIKIISRNGQTVFHHKGGYTPWDGKFNNKDVPVGTYYYTIYLNEDFKTLSGWVFVMR